MPWVSSNVERFYAFVQTKDGDLGEQLVAMDWRESTDNRGAARSLNLCRRTRKTSQLENEAKRQQVGGWGDRTTIEWDKSQPRRHLMPRVRFL